MLSIYICVWIHSRCSTADQCVPDTGAAAAAAADAMQSKWLTHGRGMQCTRIIKTSTLHAHRHAHPTSVVRHSFVCLCSILYAPRSPWVVDFTGWHHGNDNIDLTRACILQIFIAINVWFRDKGFHRQKLRILACYVYKIQSGFPPEIARHTLQVRQYLFTLFSQTIVRVEAVEFHHKQSLWGSWPVDVIDAPPAYSRTMINSLMVKAKLKRV